MISNAEKILRQIENPLGITDLEVRILSLCISSSELTTELELYGYFKFDNNVYSACESLYEKKLASPEKHPIYEVYCCNPTPKGKEYYNLLRSRFEQQRRRNKAMIGKFIVGACTTVAALVGIVDFIISHR